MPPTIPSQLPLRLLQKTSSSSITQIQSCLASQRRHESIVGALTNIRSSYNKRIRVGRGPSSGYGKTSGRGHKGQKQHGNSVPRNFEGGQTPVEKTHAKRGFVNVFSKEYTTVPLTRIQSWIAQGRIASDRPITPRELIVSRCVSDPKDGIKLLANSRSHERSLDAQPPLSIPLNIVVSRASSSAIEAIEKAGGSVQTRYYTKWAMEKMVKGEMHPILSLRSEEVAKNEASIEEKYKYRLPDATSRKAIEYYRDANHRGYLAYTVGEHEGPSLFHKPPRHVTREEIEEKRKLRGTGGGEQKVKINVDENTMW